MENVGDKWTSLEKKVARDVFDKAYQREITALIQEVRVRANAIAEIDDLWQIHDFLSARRHEIDGKYDYRYSVLLFVFARLIQDGWLQLDELASLNQEKLAKISALTRM
jgi:hypothetical protein